MRSLEGDEVSKLAGVADPTGTLWSPPRFPPVTTLVPRIGFIEPMMPALVDSAPDGSDWIHELKYDGYRTQLASAARTVAPTRAAATIGATYMPPSSTPSAGWTADQLTSTAKSSFRTLEASPTSGRFGRSSLGKSRVVSFSWPSISSTSTI
jgi:hypothetical protein